MLTYISNSAHYSTVLARAAAVKHTFWIGTADIKPLHVKAVAGTKPFFVG